MKRIIGLLAIFLAGCGGSSVSPLPQFSQTVNPPPGPIVFMGDSLTLHWGDPVWARAQLLTLHLPGAIDVGVGGQQTKAMWERFSTDVLSEHPSVIVILGGTNDVILESINNAPVDTQYLFDMIQSAEASGAHVIVGTLPPDYYIHYTIDQAARASWNDQIRAGAATYGYQIADYYAAMVLPDGTQNQALFYADREHPIEAGYAIMWDVLKPELVQLGVAVE